MEREPTQGALFYGMLKYDNNILDYLPVANEVTMEGQSEQEVETEVRDMEV